MDRGPPLCPRSTEPEGGGLLGVSGRREAGQAKPPPAFHAGSAPPPWRERVEHTAGEPGAGSGPPCRAGSDKRNPCITAVGHPSSFGSTDLAAGAVTPDPPLFDGGRTCVRRLLLGFCHGYEDCGRLLLNWLGRRHRAGSRLGGSLAFSPLLSAYGAENSRQHLLAEEADGLHAETAKRAVCL